MLHKLYRSASHVIASTTYIAERIEQLGQSVTTISTCYDGAAWEDEPKEIVTDGPVLGWTGFVKVRRHDLAVLKPWLGSFIKQHDLRVIHAGWCPGIERETAFAEATGIDPERVSVQKAVTPDRYPASGLMNGTDIGLVPLGTRAASRAKSALKGLEFGCRGIPFVASPGGEYRKFPHATVVGESLEGQTPKAWEEALERLLDPSERASAVFGPPAELDIRNRWVDWLKLLGEDR